MAFVVPDDLAEAFGYIYRNHGPFASFMLGKPLRLLCHDIPGYAFLAGNDIHCNQEFFGTLTHQQQSFIICHEIAHRILRHSEILRGWQQAGKVTGQLKNGQKITFPYSNFVAQHTLDYLINDMLLMHGFTSEHTPKELLWNPDKFGGWLDVEHDIYVRVYEAYKNDDKIDKQGEPTDKARGGDKPGEGGEDIIPAEQEKLPDAIETKLIQEALKKISGKLPGHQAGKFMELIERVAPTRIDWRDIVRPRIQSVLGTGKLAWDQLDRRYLSLPMIAPKTIGRRAGFVVLAMDTSGSISKDECRYWLGALTEIIGRCAPKRLIVLEVDTQVASVTEIKNKQELKNYIRGVGEDHGLRGRGGTNMCAIGQWLNDHKYKPDLTIILTDGYTPFPYDMTPSKDVVWVMTTTVVAPANAGRSVRMLMN